MNKFKDIEVFRLFENQSNNVPMFIDKVSAGFPSPASDYIEHKLDLNEYLISHPAATFIVKVHGSSMTDSNIRPGDLLIVDKSLTPKHNSIVIASIFGDLTVKQLKRKHQKTFLVSSNNNYPNFEVKEEMDFFVCGVVTYTIHSTIAK